MVVFWPIFVEKRQKKAKNGLKARRKLPENTADRVLKPFSTLFAVPNSKIFLLNFNQYHIFTAIISDIDVSFVVFMYHSIIRNVI